MKMKKLLSVLLALAMILCACNVLVLAEGETIVVGQGDDLQSIIDSMENGSTLVLGEDIDLSNNEETGLSGTGTAEDPFIVETVDDLKWFRDDVNGGNTYSGKYVKLTADIDLDGENWIPIGDADADKIAFRGTFDGDNHTISNLYIWADDTGLGFFGKTGSFNESEKTVIKNIRFYNVDVSNNGDKSYVGGVIANSSGNTTISNVHLSGYIYVAGYGYVGGIVGHGYPKIDNCSVIAEDDDEHRSYIHANYWCAGGIVGYGGEGGTVIKNSTVSNIDVWSAYGGAAAICGLANSGSVGENLTASNVDVSSASDFCMGYVFGNGEEGTLTNIVVNDVTATANDKPITSTDAVATIDNAVYFTLAEAVAAAVDGDTVQLSAGTFEPIDFSGKDINLIGTVADDGTLLTVFEGGNPALTMHNVNGTVKDIKIVNAWKAVYAEPAGNVTFDNVDMFNCTYGLHLVAYSNDVVWNVQNCEMDLTWANSLGKHNCDGATINIKNNVFKGTNPYNSDYGVLSVNSFSNKITVEDNVFGENTKIYFEYEDTEGSVVIGANYYADGYENAFADDSQKTKIDTYYEDEAMTKLAVALPTATVNVLDADSLGLTFARQFIADEVSDTVLDEYGSWFADFVISFNKDVTFNANGGADGYLSGQYDAWGENWVNVPFGDVTVKANEPLKIMEYAAKLMGQSGLKLPYIDVYNFVKNFSCGIYFTPEYLAANPDLKVDLSLSMFDPADETVAYAIGQSMEFVAPTVVAKVDEVGYATLQEAIDAANGKTVTVLKDIELTEGVTVANGNVVTLDLNGHKITVAYDEETGKHIYALDNKGTLTLKDSVGTGSVTARGIYNNGVMVVESGSYNAIDDNGGAAIFNYADLTVNGGTFYGATAAINNRESATAVINNATINGGAASYALQNNGGTLTVENATVLGNFGAVGTWGGLTTINNGTYSHTGNYGAHVVYVGDGKVVINGGTFKDDTNNTENYQYTILVNKSDAIVEINDGTFFGVVSPNGNVIIADNIGTVKISGGNFTGSLTKGDTSNVNIAISGGTFTEKPADEYVAIDYIVKPNEDGTYGIVEETVIFGGVYARINMPILEEDGKEYYQVTFYSGIDSLKYKEVGFELYVDGVMFAKSATNTVYGAISGVDENGDPIRVTAQELGSYRIFALTAQLAVEDNWDDTPIIFRSYALDLNGNTIYGGFWMIDDIYTKE